MKHNKEKIQTLICSLVFGSIYFLASPKSAMKMIFLELKEKKEEEKEEEEEEKEEEEEEGKEEGGDECNIGNELEEE
jgi:hypothetical protein